MQIQGGEQYKEAQIYINVVLGSKNFNKIRINYPMSKFTIYLDRGELKWGSTDFLYDSTHADIWVKQGFYAIIVWAAPYAYEAKCCQLARGQFLS